MTETIRIVLLCDNIIRELAGLKLLKAELEKRLDAQVHIVGSIAEIQRTYRSLYQIKPHAVFISQIMEKDCREIAAYVKRSGAIMCVLPVEVTPAKAVESIIVSPELKYDHLLDLIFLPGQRMHSYFNKSNIKKNKLLITGSPKMDVMVQSTGLSRDEFFSRQNISDDRLNVFLFTSFPRTSLDYFKSDKCFVGNMKLMERIHAAIRETHQAYLKLLPKICAELPEVNIILKPHPLEDMSCYHEIAVRNFHVIGNTSIRDCIGAMDVAIHWNSTVCTEFWLYDIPTLQFTPLKKHDWLLSDFSPGNPVYHDYKKLTKAIKEQLKGKKQLDKSYLAYQKKYFTENFYKVDGKSSKRIAKILKEKINKTDFNLAFRKNFHPATTPLIFTEKIVGVRLSRRLIASLTHSYNWQYAADNYLP